jgi:tol-pal system protein YbgF
MAMKPWLRLSSLVGMSLVAGCTLQSDLQAVRADLAALERDSFRRNQEVSARLDALDKQLNSPDNNTRRELAETGATMDELRVEVQNLNGQVQELQYRLQNNVGASPEMGDRLATKLAELETRLGTIEQRVDPQGGAPLTLPPEKPKSPPLGGTPPSDRQAARSRPPTQPPISGSTAQPSQNSAPAANAERLYERALQEYEAQNHEVAIVLFKQFMRQYPEHELAGHGQYWLGEALYAQEQYEAAIVAFDEVEQKYADNSKVPAAILKQGYAFAALKDNSNARFFLQQVQQKYPDSPEAKQAADRLKTLN